MKKKVYAVFASICLISFLQSCGMDCTTGSGNQISEERKVETFNKIDVSGSVKLMITQSATQLLKITADDNVLKDFKTSVSGNTLKIELEGNFCNAGPILVETSTANLEAIEASGAVEVKSVGQINAQDFSLNLSGSSKTDLDLIANRLSTKSSGSSVIVLKGQAAKHDIDISGSTDIKAFDFVVADYDIESSGSSNCDINVLNKLNISSSGVSNISYKGNPKTVNNDKSGSSNVKKVE